MHRGKYVYLPFSSISWKHLPKIPGIDKPDGVVKLERANAVTSGEPNNNGDCISVVIKSNWKSKR